MKVIPKRRDLKFLLDEIDKMNVVRIDEFIKISNDQQEGPVQDFPISCADTWHAQLLVTLCHSHWLSPHRYKGQRRTTVVVRTSKLFMDTVLWPEFSQYKEIFDQCALSLLSFLEEHLSEKAEDEEVSEVMAFLDSLDSLSPFDPTLVKEFEA